MKEILDLFLEKTPDNINIDELKSHLLQIDGIDDVHHIHIWSIDGFNNYATMHVVTNTSDLVELKAKIREELSEHKIVHAVIETENVTCNDTECHPVFSEGQEGHHHHH